MASELIDVTLYNGQFHLIHNPTAKGSSPRYKIVDADGKIIAKPRGVTTILGQTLAKDLVGWALDMFEAALKPMLPMVTEADLADAKQASARRRDSGANVGTEVHTAIEQFMRKKMELQNAAQT